MNRRKAKKAIKGKYKISKWPRNASPRDVEKCCIALGQFFDRWIAPIIRERMEGRHDADGGIPGAVEHAP